MSASARRQHLDAFAGRDVVYCHFCENEWYHDSGGLQCPRCSSEATEIVTRENDPRNLGHDGPASHPSIPERFHHSADTDSDPEEEGIEHHVHRGPNGMFFSRTEYRNPPRLSRAGSSGPVPPASGDAIMNRFFQMVGEMSPGLSGSDNSNPVGSRFADHTTTVPRATVTLSSGGRTGFTITTTPLRVEPGANRGPPGAGDEFGLLFRTMMGNIVAPVGNSPIGAANSGTSGGNAADRSQETPPHGFPLQFHQLLGAIFGIPGNANWGDVVTSQQELDRIISTLMEANPQSNAAPPASQTALDKLERKKLDASMIGNDDKVECTICIDELHQGDDVTVLPCKHWFHDECVVLWLKEHNTCPICRAPIEERPRASSSSPPPAPVSSGWGPAGSGIIMPSLFNLGPPAPRRSGGESSSSPSPNQQQTTPSPSTSRPTADSGSFRRRDRVVRTPSENEERLNTIRNNMFTSGQSGGSGNINNNNNGNGNSNHGTPFRRNSLSPPNPGFPQQPQQQQPQQQPGGDFDSGTSRPYAISRDRSPPESSSSRFRLYPDSDRARDRDRDRERDRESDRDRRELPRRSSHHSGGSNNSSNGGNGGNHGPISWLRDRLPGSSSSSGRSNGDYQRRR